MKPIPQCNESKGNTRTKRTTGTHPAGNTLECNTGHNGSGATKENWGANDNKQKSACKDGSNKQ